MNSLERLGKALGHGFSQPKLLEQALTHRSFSGRNNERLEFLGDAVLGLVVAEALFQQFPDEKEGHLSRYRAHLVKGQALGRIAAQLGIADHLLLGPGEMKSGGFRRESILADALEAIIGAIYLDAGLEKAKTTVLGWLQPHINQLNTDDFGKDPKTRLQEWLQAQRKNLPTYEVISIEGEDHNQVFHIACITDALPGPIYGRGTSRKKAEQQAAERALATLHER